MVGSPSDPQTRHTVTQNGFDHLPDPRDPVCLSDVCNGGFQTCMKYMCVGVYHHKIGVMMCPWK